MAATNNYSHHDPFLAVTSHRIKVLSDEKMQWNASINPILGCGK